MAHNPSSLGRAGARTLQFIETQQKKAITNRNKGTPILRSKIKLLKTSKLKRKPTLRGTA